MLFPKLVKINHNAILLTFSIALSSSADKSLTLLPGLNPPGDCAKQKEKSIRDGLLIMVNFNQF